MRAFRPAIVALSVLLSACGGATSPTSPAAAVPTPTPLPARVVIVSVDGLRGDVVQMVNPPNLSALIQRGAYTFQAQTINPSNTLPSHTSMMTGYLPAKHGITWDDYLPANGTIRVPTIFFFARKAGLPTALVAGKEKFNTFRDTGEMDVFVGGTRPDADVAEQAIAALYAGARLAVVHLPDVDLSGHATSWMSDTYKDRVTKADAALGRIVAALPGNTTLILTADHGGHASGHGTTDRLDMSIPWIIAGPGVRQGYALTGAVSTMDTAATAAYVLGLTLSADVTGKPVMEAFVR